MAFDVISHIKSLLGDHGSGPLCRNGREKMAATYNGIERSTADISPGSELYASKNTYICFLALPQP